MFKSSGKPFAVVTGASSGIGYELARQFAENGFDLLIAAEDQGIFPAARSIRSLGCECRPVQADLAGWDGVERLYSEILSSGRPVDAIAINAGVGVSGDFAKYTDLRAEINLINLNVTSSVHLAKRLLRDMVIRAKAGCCSRRLSPQPCPLRSRLFTALPRHFSYHSQRRCGMN